jgi:hypothetical protein
VPYRLMRAVTAAAALAPLLITAQTAAAQQSSRPANSTLGGLVTTHYDSTTDSTRVRTATFPVRGALKMYAGYRFAGSSPAEPPSTIYLVFQEATTAPTWESPHGRRLELWVDGREKIVVDRTEYLRRAEYERGPLMVDVTEWVWATIPPAIFAKIAGAKRVEGRLGRRSFELEGEQLETLRELASRLPSTASATANGAVEP